MDQLKSHILAHKHGDVELVQELQRELKPEAPSVSRFVKHPGYGSFLCFWNRCEARFPVLDGDDSLNYHVLLEGHGLVRNQKKNMEKTPNGLWVHTKEVEQNFKLASSVHFLCEVEGCEARFEKIDELHAHQSLRSSDDHPDVC